MDRRSAWSSLTTLLRSTMASPFPPFLPGDIFLYDFSMSSAWCGIFLFQCSRGAGRCYLTTWKAAGTRRTFRNISSSALSSGGLTSTVTTKKQMLPEISCFVFFFTDIYLQAWFLSGMLFTTRPLTTSQFLWRISRETSWWTGKGWSLSLPLLHNQDDDDHYPQVRLRGGRLRPLLGAQRAHLPRRREVPRQGSSCPRLQVSFVEPSSLSLSSSSQLLYFSHWYHFCISPTNIHYPTPRDATEFAGKRLLLVGSSYSAEDIALQCLK